MRYARNLRELNLIIKKGKGYEKVIKIVAGMVLVISQTACASLVGESLFTEKEEGRFLLSTDAEGMRAFADGMNGLITTGKSAPNVEDSYWNHRAKETQFKALRFSAKKQGGEK
jgi:hypothetical protein